MQRALALGLFFALAVVQPARAAQQIGVTVDSRLRVSTIGAAGSKVLIASAPVFRNDRLVANATGLAQIRFVDDTKLVLGPNSSVTLDKFVFSGDSSAKTVSVSVTKGAFRFISGRSGSRAYSIRTPAGSIGVRGTAFDVTVQGGTTNVVLLRGQVNICPRSGGCRLVRSRCEYVAFNRNGFLQRSSVDPQRYRNLFPLLSNARGILPQFQGGSAGCRGSTTQSGIRHARAATVPSKPGRPPAPPPEPPVPPVDPPTPPPPTPPPTVDPPGRSLGNPGNTKAVGRAGLSPNGRQFGLPGRGRSDASADVFGFFGFGTSATGASTGGFGGGAGAGGGKGTGSGGAGAAGNGGGKGSGVGQGSGGGNGGGGHGGGNGGGHGGGNGGGHGGGHGNGGGHGGGQGNGGGNGNGGGQGNGGGGGQGNGGR